MVRVFDRNMFIMLAAIMVGAVIITYFKIKKEWTTFFNFSIPIIYIGHLIWFLNNPVIGNKISLVSSPHLNIYFSSYAS